MFIFTKPLRSRRRTHFHPVIRGQQFGNPASLDRRKISKTLVFFMGNNPYRKETAKENPFHKLR